MIRLVLPVLLLLSGCGLLRHAPGPMPAPRYVVGAGYQAGGTWYYPAEDFHYDATGLAEVLPDRAGLTADGEAFDGAALAGAHQTLQLPAIARVTNLDTGLQALLRINDRGPASPARLLGVTRHAAALLGLRPGEAGRVRVAVEDGPSQALRDSLGGAALQVAVAPRGAVSAEALAPPPGTGQSSRGRVAGSAAAVRGAEPVGGGVPMALPDAAQLVPVDPGQLWIKAGQFGQPGYANQVQAKLYGLSARVEAVRTGRSQVFRVRAGPFASVAAADAALDQAMRAGVTDARIVVE